MSILSKTILSAATALTVSVGAAFMATAPAQAAGLSNPTALSETLLQDGSDVIKVRGERRRGGRHRGNRRRGNRHRGNRGRRHGRRHGRRYRPRFDFYVDYGGYPECYWRTKRRWSEYHGRYIRRKVRICY